MKRFYGTAGALLVALLVATPTRATAQTYDTPQKAFDAFKEAAKKDEWKTVCAILTEDSGKMMAGAMAAGTMFIKGFIDAFAEKDETGKLKEIAKTIDDLAKKHNITQETIAGIDFKELVARGKKNPEDMKKAFTKVGAKLKDYCAFLADFGAMSKKIPGKQGSPLESAANATLKGVQEMGDTAKGMIVTTKDGKEKSEPIEFKKVGGSWKIEIPLPTPGGPGGAALYVPRAIAQADALNTRPVAVAERRTR